MRFMIYHWDGFMWSDSKIIYKDKIIEKLESLGVEDPRKEIETIIKFGEIRYPNNYLIRRLED